MPCFVCDKRYKTEGALRKHLKKKHLTFFEETLDVGAVASSNAEHEEEILCQNPSPVGSPSISCQEKNWLSNHQTSKLHIYIYIISYNGPELIVFFYILFSDSLSLSIRHRLHFLFIEIA